MPPSMASGWSGGTCSKQSCRKNSPQSEWGKSHGPAGRLSCVQEDEPWPGQRGFCGLAPAPCYPCGRRANLAPKGTAGVRSTDNKILRQSKYGNKKSHIKPKREPKVTRSPCITDTKYNPCQNDQTVALSYCTVQSNHVSITKQGKPLKLSLQQNATEATAGDLTFWRSMLIPAVWPLSRPLSLRKNNATSTGGACPRVMTLVPEATGPPSP